jgi:hypothetical protein
MKGSRSMILVRNVAPHGSARPVDKQHEQQTPRSQAHHRMGQLVRVFRKATGEQLLLRREN